MEIPGIRLVLQVFGFLLASWFLVHILAILGLFLAVAYPIWWLLFPEKMPCIFCRFRNKKTPCAICGRTQSEHQRVYHVESLRVAIINSLLIVLFTFVSLFMLFLEAKVLDYFGFPATEKTVTMYLPSKGQYYLNQIFDMDIQISGAEVPINAVQADFSFDKDRLELLDISTEKSFANIFLHKEINNQAGFARLSGGLPNPGFTESYGVFGTMIFRTKLPGLAQVEFLPSSMVLANDGKGSNVLKDIASVSYMVLPEDVGGVGSQSLDLLMSQNQEKQKASISGKQLIFYNEEEVLGASVAAEEKVEEKKQNLFQKLLDLLARYVNFVLGLWHLVTDLILGK